MVNNRWPHQLQTTLLTMTYQGLLLTRSMQYPQTMSRWSEDPSAKSHSADHTPMADPFRPTA